MIRNQREGISLSDYTISDLDYDLRLEVDKSQHFLRIHRSPCFHASHIQKNRTHHRSIPQRSLHQTPL